MEQAASVLGRETTELVKLHIQEPGDLVSRVKEMGRLIPLASECLRRQVGAVGFQEQAIRLGFSYDLAKRFVLGVGDRPGD